MTRIDNLKWRYIEDQPNEYLKDVEYAGFWWTNAIPKFQLQLTAKAVKALYPHYRKALDAEKPFTFFITDDVRAKWRKIDSKRGPELYVSQYGNDIWTNYDPKKITHLATNSVSTYYDWSCLPESLKAFIEFPEVTP